MRDIRPNQRKDDEPEAEIELYEASSQAKEKLSKRTRGQRDQATIAKVAETQNNTDLSGAKRKFLGSRVPIMNIHVTDKTVHSDANHKQKKGEVPGKPKAKPPKPGQVRVAHGERLALLFFFGLVMVAGGLATALLLPTASIVLDVRSAPLLVDEELVIAANGSGDVMGTVFFRELRVEDSVEVIGRELEGTKAEGVVELVNKTLDEQAIRERSRLVTADDQLFYMIADAFVPPNSRVKVRVEAAEAGEAGNIKAQRLNFAALDESSQSLVYAEVTDEVSGGSGEEVTVVTEADLEAARQAALQIARQQVEQEIVENEVPDGWALLEESWRAELVDFKTEAVVGDKKPRLNYEAQMIVRVIGFELNALDEKLHERLESQLSDEFMLFPDSISYTKTLKEVNWDEAIARIVARVTHTTVPALSLDTMKDKLAGRSVDETQVYLEGLPGIQAAKIDTWPFWVRAIPRIEKRISIDLETNRP